MDSLFGLRVQVTPDIPKMTLSKDVPVSPWLREEMDRWMLEFFGTTNLIPDGRAYVMEDPGIVIMNKRTYLQMRTMAAQSFTPTDVRQV